MAGNPALNDNIFERETKATRGGAFTPGWGSPADEVPPGLFGGSGSPGTTPPAGAVAVPGPVGTSEDVMRLGGTLSAAGVLLGLLIVAAWFGWQAVTVETATTVSGDVVVTSSLPGWILLASLVGFGIAMLTVFKPRVSMVTGPLYAAVLGTVVGALSKFYEVQFQGIVLQAVGLTIGVFVMMLVLYATRTIRVTDRLRTGIIAATGAVLLVYLASFVLRLFGSGVPMIHESGPMGILFSLAVVGIASFNLLLDFDLIERGVQMQAPRYMEWFGAFGLMVTLVWLYLEMLRLLAKLRQR